jgi:hypothetical protein
MDVTMQYKIYEGVSKSFQTGHLEQELQVVQLSATRYSHIAILCQFSEFCCYNFSMSVYCCLFCY